MFVTENGWFLQLTPIPIAETWLQIKFNQSEITMDSSIIWIELEIVLFILVIFWIEF